MRPRDLAFFDRPHRLHPGGGDDAEVQPCKVCGGVSRPFDRVDFLKFCSTTDCYGFGFSGVDVTYLRCSSCGFIFTTFFDDWTQEDFAQHVYNEDYALVDGEYAEVRPSKVAAGMAEKLEGLNGLRLLDYGSGSGAFAARMRAAGFLYVESYDPFSNPSRPSGQFDLITCFEVIEHTISPVDALRDMRSLLNEGGCIVFSQALQPPDIERIRGNWWYIAPRNGHVSIFGAEALAALAARVDFSFFEGAGWYAFAPQNPSPESLKLLGRIGLPVLPMRLFAPNAANSAGWHSLERTGSLRFRWTADSEVPWPAPDPFAHPCRLRITVPFVNEIQTGFAEGCRLRIQGREISLIREDQRLVAETVLDKVGSEPIVLLTPPPASPYATRGAPDHRVLGLAIPI
ncbi:MAG: class I SAM-dependent methyltransferase, partial [Acetobacteraceae bacterium]|nr:class I SAM-dependent methyltransferase [Acetobacteraceae bacterium]